MIEEMNDKEANKQFWEKFNEICINCKLKCKQSSKVKIDFCAKCEAIKVDE